ncbi:MAG: hypothetical protein ACXU89_01965 [Xanthobacteraceae bacterium]
MKRINHVITLIVHAATCSDQTQPARPPERFDLQLVDRLMAEHVPR